MSYALAVGPIPATTLGWILRLRWTAVVGQLATIAITRYAFDVAVPVGSLVGIVAVTAVTNALLQFWMRGRTDVSPLLLTGVLGIDTLSLSALLYLTGGPTNPLSVLYLVQITIAALVLRARYTVPIVVLSTAGYAFLFFRAEPLPGMEMMMHMHHAGMGLHLQGMFAAFALAAMLIAYFVGRVATALREREAQLALAERAAAANERLASLSTLAAGAAHELGTPLGTIAVAAKELERALANAELAEDARLIRQQVDRCRDIVQQMSARSPGAMGEVAESVAVDDLVKELHKRIDAQVAPRLDVKVDGAAMVKVPVRGLAQVLASLVKNAFDASANDAHVTLAIANHGPRTSFAVIDEGKGIAPDELAHVGEPFFTTKEPGAGMGLGVFLARAFADRFGGGLTLTSELHKGTRAILELPHE